MLYECTVHALSKHMHLFIITYLTVVFLVFYTRHILISCVCLWVHVCVYRLFVRLWSGGEGQTTGHQTALTGKKIQQHKQNHGQCDTCHLRCDRGQTPERHTVSENPFEVGEQLCCWFGSIVFPALGRYCCRADAPGF